MDELYNQTITIRNNVWRTYPGIIPPPFPDIMAEMEEDPLGTTFDANSTECFCSDLHARDYSPLYAWFNYIVIIVILPSLSVFGVFTNIVNVFIYSRKRMRNSANTYLLFLGGSDFLVILTGLFIFWIDSARSYIKELARAPYTTVYTLPFGYMAQTCSIYFTVAAAVDCYVNVCWKSVSGHYCTVRRARQIIVAVVFMSIVYNSLRFPQFNLRKCLHEGSQEFVIEICPTTLFFTVNTIYNVYMYTLIMTLLPFLFLLILNAFIVVKQSFTPPRSTENSCPENLASYLEMERSIVLLRSEATLNRLRFANRCKSACDSQEEENSKDDTITMIMVVVLFLCCNTLALIVNIIETFFDPDPLLLNLLSDASNFLVIFNSSVNCIIYLIFNKEYRELFIFYFGSLRRVLCCCCESKSRRNSEYQSRLLYKLAPMRSLDVYYKKPSVSLLVRANTVEKHQNRAYEVRNHSPIWKPLTSRWKHRHDSNSLEPNADGGFWNRDFSEQVIPGSQLCELPRRSPSFSYNPSCSDMVLDDNDERDSGWDEGDSTNIFTPTNRRPGPFSTTWLAEVKIMENSLSAGRPHIYVKPIKTYGSTDMANMSKMSITAL